MDLILQGHALGAILNLVRQEATIDLPTRARFGGLGPLARDSAENPPP